MSRLANVVRPAALVAALFLAACAGMDGGARPAPTGAAVRGLGETYRSSHGDVHLARIQDEYKLIRCIPTGPIAGWYQDVFKVSRDAITDETRGEAPYRWNQWIPVRDMPGLELMFLAPDRIAFREVTAAK